MKPQIFLSYSRNDIEIMQHVKDSLIARGLDIWTDELLPIGSPQWEKEIAFAIEKSGAMVVLLTPSAKESIWVARELSYAEDHNIRIFPILADGNEKTSVPFRLTSTQRIDVRTGFASGIRELVQALHHYLGIDVAREQANNAEILSQFISNSIHDLRTPLSVIASSTSLLRRYRDRMELEKQDMHLDRIENQIKYLSQFLDDISDISRLDRRLLPIPDEGMEINSILGSLISDYVSLAEIKNISLTFNPSLDKVFVFVDNHQFRRAASNLIINAINYTLEDGNINIHVKIESKMAIIYFSDTGVGIADKDKPNIFKRFYRAENANVVSPNGTGLGLAITKEIIEFYGGNVSFTSEIGKGTIFIISLPIYKIINESN